MRAWKIVLSGIVAALGVAVALLRPGLSAVPHDGVVPLLLPRLPALAVALIAVYALVAILFCAAGLVTAALDLRRELARTDALSHASAALDWVAAFDMTALRGLVPRNWGASSQSPAYGRARIAPDSRFDRSAARAEVAHLYYLWLARSQALAALVGLAAIAALGFAQDRGGVPYLTGRIPTATAVVVLVALLLLLLLARLAIDVATEPLIDAIWRLPGEPADAGRWRHAMDPIDTGLVGRAAAQLPPEVAERLALALEDGGRGLTAAGERLSAAAGALDVLSRKAAEALAAASRDRAASREDGDGQLGALQAAVEALTGELKDLAGRAAAAREAAGDPTMATADFGRELLDLLQDFTPRRG